MSEQASPEALEKELYVLKNPFREPLGDIVISPTEELRPTKPGLPIHGKVYTIPQNVLYSEYVIHSITRDTTTRSISGNVGTLLRVQNNHTEILTYLVNILFNEVSEPIKKMLKRIRDDVNELRPVYQDSQPDVEEIDLSLEIGNLRLELESIKEEIKKTNSNLEKLLERI